MQNNHQLVVFFRTIVFFLKTGPMSGCFSRNGNVHEKVTNVTCVLYQHMCTLSNVFYQHLHEKVTNVTLKNVSILFSIFTGMLVLCILFSLPSLLIFLKT